MMRFIVIILISLFPLLARAQDAVSSFDALNKAVKTDDATAGGKYLTQSSQELFHRFASYNLMECLPKDASYQSKKDVGQYEVIDASITDLSDKKRKVHLVFAAEQSVWKLDLPQTLRLGMGDSWQKRINNAEQLYLLLKVQMGDKLTCSTIKEVIKG